jgi:hypothetical protein
MKCTGVAVWGVVGVAGALLGGCGSSGGTKVDGGGTGGSGGTKVDGGGTGGLGGTGGSGGGAENDCHDAMTKFCDRAQTCEPGSFGLSGFTSLADCVSYFEASCDDAVAAPHTGRTAALVQQCGDGWAAMSCADFVQGKSVPACLPQGGTAPVGGSCNNDWQCATGVCWQTASTCGTCAAVTTVGQPCQVDATRGLLCPDNLVCTEADASGSMLVCSAYVPIGGPCIQTEVCGDNAYCDPTTNVCTQLPALGQGCSGIYDIDNCDPTQAASSCDGTTCTPVAAAADGQPCGTVNGTYFRCNGECSNWTGTTGVCHAYLPRGASCTSTDLCVADTPCNGGTCTSPVCDGTVSSGKDAAVAASVIPAGARERRRVLRWPGMPTGATPRR